MESKPQDSRSSPLKWFIFSQSVLLDFRSAVIKFASQRSKKCSMLSHSAAVQEIAYFHSRLTYDYKWKSGQCIKSFRPLFYLSKINIGEPFIEVTCDCWSKTHNHPENKLKLKYLVYFLFITFTFITEANLINLCYHLN